MAKWGGPLMVIAFFWFGWTSYDSISPWSPIISGLPLGVALTFLFVRQLTVIPNQRNPRLGLAYISYISC